jgi:hypothetical protein
MMLEIGFVASAVGRGFVASAVGIVSGAAKSNVPHREQYLLSSVLS